MNIVSEIKGALKLYGKETSNKKDSSKKVFKEMYQEA